jgi:hypothetical protein
MLGGQRAWNRWHNGRQKVGITQPAVSKAVQRGEKLSLDNNFRHDEEGIL